jgi:hypothetical protein
MARSPRVGAQRSGAIGILLASVLAWAPSAPVAAAYRLDLSTAVLTHVDGFTVAPLGVGFSGPLTNEQLAPFVPDDDVRHQLLDGRVYARTFVRTGGREIGILAFDFGSRAAVHEFLAGARESAARLGGVVVRIAGLEAFRTAVPPERAANRSIQEVYLAVGRVAFVLYLSDRTSAPVTDADATDLALAQAAAVPSEVAAAKDEPAGFNAAYRAGQALGVFTVVTMVVAAVVLSGRRHLR